MDVWKHCLLSQRKFGGDANDYAAVHRFIDSSKLYFFHFRHRALLHNLFGIELAIELLGDFIETSKGRQVLVRDVAAAHCQEDLSGKVPSLYDWFVHAEEDIGPYFEPLEESGKLAEFVNRPYLRSGLKCSLMISCSDFGVGLVERFVGANEALEWRSRVSADRRVAKYLGAVPFDRKWMHTPDPRELAWLSEQEKQCH